MNLVEFGLLPKYKDASLSKLHPKASKDVVSFAKKVLSVSRAKFYSDGINMYIYGSYRVGKTFLLHCVANHIVNVYKDNSVYFVKSTQLLKYFKEHTIWRNDYSWISFLRSRRVLLVDALGQEYRGSGSGFAETSLEEFFRWRVEHNKITYIESNASVDTLKGVYGESFSNFISSEFVSFELDDAVNIGEIIKQEKLKRILKR